MPPHLGSLDAILDSAGVPLVKEAYSAFGVRRDPIDWSGMPSSSADAYTRQGYTFQTVLERMGLNHMNGRVQDAITGTFLSPDPFIPDVTDTQSYNRYAYVGNNPLTYNDPSGFCPECGRIPWVPPLIPSFEPSVIDTSDGQYWYTAYGSDFRTYMWNAAGIDTGEFNCRDTYESCDRQWKSSPYYTEAVTNPLHRAFPIHLRKNGAVAASTVTSGMNRKPIARIVSQLEAKIAEAPLVKLIRPSGSSSDQ